MKRRNFLRGSALSLLTLPTWLGCAFQKGGSVDFSAPDEMVDNAVGRAFLKAQRIGKPLLVIVVPKDEIERYKRGHAWGEFLNYGELWPLALCEVICANESELSELTPVSGEPLFYLLEGDAGSVKATPFNTKLSFFSDKGQEADVEAHISTLGALVKGALAKDAAMIKARAAAVTATLSKAAVAQFKADFEGSFFVARGGDAALAAGGDDRYAALIASFIPTRQGERAELERFLAQLASARLKAKKIEGSRWARASICGPDAHEDATAEERKQQGMYRCGMGFVPAKSRRFLTFYAASTT